MKEPIESAKDASVTTNCVGNTETFECRSVENDHFGEDLRSLAVEGQKLAGTGSPKSVSSSAAPVVQSPAPAEASLDDLPICQQGPCRHFLKVQKASKYTPSGLQAEYSCLLGTKLVQDDIDDRLKDMPQRVRLLVSPVMFPQTCSRWEPFTDAELDDVAARRLQYQDRAAKIRDAELAAEAARETELASAKELPEDPGRDLPVVEEAVAQKQREVPELPDDLSSMMPDGANENE